MPTKAADQASALQASPLQLFACFFDSPAHGQRRFGAAAFLINRAAFLASSAVSNPTMAENFLPILEFLRSNRIEMKIRRGHFWLFWELAGRQVAKTGSKTRKTIEGAYADSLKRALHPQQSRRVFGRLAPRSWVLRQQGFTVREIADELNTTEGAIKDALRRARKYQDRDDFQQAVEAIRAQETGIDVPSSDLPSAVALAVIEGRRRRGHKIQPETAESVAAGIREYCQTLKITTDVSIIAAAAAACPRKAKRTLLNAVKNAFARTKAESMSLIGDLAAVYRNICFEDRWGHFSIHKAVLLSVETLRLVYRETGGDLQAIPWEVLSKAVRELIWPNRVLERIRDWQGRQETRIGVGRVEKEEPAMLAAA